MKNKKKSVLVLGIILLIGLTLRLYQVGRLPVILNRDEAALAYNAFLLQNSGLDEWQQRWPLVFKSFGDYKLPGYIYVLTGLFTLSEPSDLVVRLPAVIAGMIIIWLAYKIGRSLGFSSNLSLFLSLLVALNPVFMFYSRMAWEANLGLMWNLIGLWLLFKPSATQLKRRIADIGGLIFLLLAVFTYNSPLFYLPFILGAVLAIRWKRTQLKNNWWLPLLGISLIVITAGLVLLPVTSQKSGITIFTDETIWTNFINYRLQFSGIWRKILGNRYLYWLGQIAVNIGSSFNPKFLVTAGGTHPWHSIPDCAHLYWVSYGLSLIGIISLFFTIAKQIKQNFFNQELLLLLALPASLLPAAITVDAPHATRSLLFMFLLMICAVYGMKFLLQKMKAGSSWIVGLVLIVLAIESGLYFHAYFTQYPHQQQPFKPGFDVVIKEMEQKFPQKEVAIVADGYQYIIAAWYLKLPPERYFQTNIRQQPDKIGLNYGQQVDNYHFIADLEDVAEDEDFLMWWDEKQQVWQIRKN